MNKLNPYLVLTANGATFEAGDHLSLSVSLSVPVWRACDVYLLADTPVGIYSINLEGTVKRGIAPAIRNVPRIDAPFSREVLRSFPIPEGVPDKTTFYAVIVEAGCIPPISRLSEFKSRTPYVITYSHYSIETLAAKGVKS